MNPCVVPTIPYDGGKEWKIQVCINIKNVLWSIIILFKLKINHSFIF